MMMPRLQSGLLLLCGLYVIHTQAYLPPIAPRGAVMTMKETASRKFTNHVERRDWLSRVVGAGVAGVGFMALVPSASFAETTTTKVVSQSKVRETANGVKYVDIVKGEGESPRDGDFVIIQYTGYLKDGTIFDGQHAKGKKPLAFKIGQKQVIPGLEEALGSMKAGGERQILVPPELAFGEKGVCLPDSECLVPPNSAVKYDVILKRVAVSPI